jgi:hypothetical protein
MELQLARGLSLFTAKGFDAIEAHEAYDRARELAKRRGDPRQQFMAVYGLWQSANGAGKILTCRRLKHQTETIAGFYLTMAIGAVGCTGKPAATPHSACRCRNGLHDVLRHVLADLVAPVASDLGR